LIRKLLPAKPAKR